METRWIPVPNHAAKIGEILRVLWSDYYGAALFGHDEEIAVLPHKRCRLEVVRTAESSHRDVALVLPGHVLRYARPFCFLDRWMLPSGSTVGLWHLVGFKLRLLPDTLAPVPSEDALLDRARESDVTRWRTIRRDLAPR